MYVYYSSVVMLSNFDCCVISMDKEINNYCVNFFYSDYARASSLSYFWLACCGFYLTNVFAISPVYVVFSLTVLYIVICFLASPQKKCTAELFLLIVLLVFLYSLPLFLSKISLVINFAMSLLSIPMTFFLFYRKKVSYKYVIYSIIFFSCLLLIDGVWRLFNPDMSHYDEWVKLNVGFQIYKVNSLMYIDSNYVGIQCVSVFSFLLFVVKNNLSYKKHKSLMFFAFFVVFMSSVITFSRAAFVGIVMCILFFFMGGVNRRLLYFLTPAVILIAAALSILFFSGDVSFLSKFYILEKMYSYLISSSINEMIFGVGLGNAVNFLGIGAHNLFVTFIVETGILGFLLFLIVLGVFFVKLKYDFLIVGFPFILSSMSLGTTAMPYFFTYLTFSYMLRKRLLALTDL